MKTFHNSAEDCQWLRDTHLRRVADRFPFGSFILHGNEDCPQRIELFYKQDPDVDDISVAFDLDDDGRYRQIA